MNSLSNALRRYVRRHNIGVAKAAYRTFVEPIYVLASIPLYDITSSAHYKYTWFRIPKNGTHSIMQMLNAVAPPDINSSSVPYFRKQHVENFRFCVLRNPWDRLVSVYCNKVRMKLMYPECWNKDFAFFIEFVSKQNLRKCDGHIRLQTAMFPTGDMDYVVRMEDFNTGMDYILNTKLRLAYTIVHIGAIEHDPYQSFYDEILRERIRQLYAEDISYGGYAF